MSTYRIPRADDEHQLRRLPGRCFVCHGGGSQPSVSDRPGYDAQPPGDEGAMAMNNTAHHGVRGSHKKLAVMLSPADSTPTPWPMRHRSTG
ncbi:hypothetical protein QF030_007926 [Streptomyces rishiriensis]|uniref:Uncharacterized protein n=1 Tax=Streptomyces rishiriensis TaxID=68264 RepID=A0ABU0P425_STRRH|nr:hypothetical protein [Streptomyces rishiriensis]